MTSTALEDIFHVLFSSSDDTSDDNTERTGGATEKPTTGYGLQLTLASQDHRVWQVASTPSISGLQLVKRFFSAQEQEAVLMSIQLEGWFEDSRMNQAMRFGDLPLWAQTIAGLIPAHLLPAEVASRSPLFDQLIVNKYLAGQGILPHVDLLRFEDAVAVLSLESSAIMTFTPCTSSLHSPPASEDHQKGNPECCCSAACNDRERHISSSKDGSTSVLLEAGDLLLLHGEARYRWRHGIAEVQQELWQGKVLYRANRTSVTLRKLKPHDTILQER